MGHAAITTLLTVACGGSDGSLADAGAVDALSRDAMPVEDRCPDQLDADLRFVDLSNGDPLFECTVQESDVAANHALSDADGRALVCATDAPEVDLIASCPIGGGDHYQRIHAGAMERLLANGHALPYPIFEPSYFAGLASSGINSPVVGELVVAVQVLSATNGQPLVGAIVNTTATNSGLVSRTADGSYEASPAIAAGGLVVTSDVPMDPVPTFSVTPPAGFAGDCVGPSSPTSEEFGAAISVLTFVCH